MTDAKILPLRRTHEGTPPWIVNPFYRVPLAIVALGVTSNSFRVYSVLCYRWYKTTGQRFEGVTVATLEDLSTETKLTKKQVRKAIGELEETGWIYKHNHGRQATIFVAGDVPQQAIEDAEKASRRMREGAMYLSDELLEEVRKCCAQSAWRKDIK